MCGIFGELHSGGRPVDLESCRLATRLLHHRGPDSSGEWLEPGRSCIYLGFRRLSILDLSESANQPMLGSNGNVLIFNGEIYNYRELRRQCEAKGVRFRTQGDTEVLLACLEIWGADALKKLEGMFGLLFWNAATRTALIARDPLGIKPVYLWRRPGNGLAVASEMKAFYALPEFAPELNTSALPEYLRFRTLASGNTMLRGVDQLNPGHVALYQPDSDRFEIRRYWSITEALLNDPQGPESRDLDGIRSLFRETVDRHLLSDVPVGAQLSGGVDSTLALAVARKDLGRRMRAFHCNVDQAELTEFEWANRCAQILDVDMDTVTLDGSTLTSGLLDELTWHMDEPLGHPNAVGVHMVSRLARPKATVLISGEGADEIFGGYPRYTILRWQAHFRRIGVHSLPASAPGWMRRAAGLAGLPLNEAIGSLTQFASLERVQRLLPGATAEQTISGRLARLETYAPAGQANPSLLCQLYDLETYLPPLCIRQDKMSMAASIENRVPFITPRMAVFGLRLPQHLRASHREHKVLLKKYLCDYVPREIVYRKKAGFQIPIEQWIWGRASEALSRPGSRLSGCLDTSSFPALLASRDEAATELAWVLLTLEIWLDIFMRRERVLEYGAVTAA